jgi:hypothetical protein
MTRQCTSCGELKLLNHEHFNYKSVADGKFGNICKPCQKQYRADHYRKNKAYYIDKAIKARTELRARNRRLLWDYLLAHPCVDCGIADPLVLEFDHVRGEKAGLIAVMIQQNTWSTVLREIEKCEVRCANCHRRRTALQLNYYKSI